MPYPTAPRPPLSPTAETIRSDVDAIAKHQSCGRRAVRSAVESMTLRFRLVAIALTISFGFVDAGCSRDRAFSSKRMADGKRWTTANLNLDIAASYCSDDA